MIYEDTGTEYLKSGLRWKNRLQICHINHLETFPYLPWAALIAQLVKNLPAMLGTPVWFLGQEDPLEKG